MLGKNDHVNKLCLINTPKRQESYLRNHLNSAHYYEMLFSNYFYSNNFILIYFCSFYLVIVALLSSEVVKKVC